MFVLPSAALLAGHFFRQQSDPPVLDTQGNHFTLRRQSFNTLIVFNIDFAHLRKRNSSPREQIIRQN